MIRSMCMLAVLCLPAAHAAAHDLRAAGLGSVAPGRHATRTARMHAGARAALSSADEIDAAAEAAGGAHAYDDSHEDYNEAVYGHSLVDMHGDDASGVAAASRALLHSEGPHILSCASPC